MRMKCTVRRTVLKAIASQRQKAAVARKQKCDDVIGRTQAHTHTNIRVNKSKSSAVTLKAKQSVTLRVKTAYIYRSKTKMPFKSFEAGVAMSPRDISPLFQKNNVHSGLGSNE